MPMTVAMRPSSEASSSPSKRGLRGPRPQPLKVSSSLPALKPSSSRKAGATPVIVYENTPKVVHARPQEFMSVVQRLTGNNPAPAPAAATSSMAHAPASSSTAAAGEEGGHPLLLTLGQRPAAPVLPSPMAAGLPRSPGFIFSSPSTMQSIQELSPLF